MLSENDASTHGFTYIPLFRSVGLALDLELQRSGCDLIVFCKCHSLKQYTL